MSKILHLQNIAEVSNGVIRHISILAKNTISHAHFLALSDNRMDEEELRNTFEDVLILSANGNFVKDFFSLLNYCKAKQINIIHSHHRYFDLQAYLISKFLHLKTITTVHSKVFGRKIFSYKSEKIIAVSNSIKFHLINYFKISEKKVEVLYNFIDPDFIKFNEGREKIRNKFNLSDDDIVIGYYGRLDLKEKGIDILIKAFSILHNSYDKVQLFLMGEGRDKDSIIKLMKTFKIKAIIIGGQNNVFDYSQVIDIFVLPSRVDPFPYVMLETAYLKIPFIGSNVDGIAEYIQDGSNGLLFDKGNFNQLAEKLNILIKDPILKMNIIKNNYNKVSSFFMKEQFIKKYDNIYSSI